MRDPVSNTKVLEESYLGLFSVTCTHKCINTHKHAYTYTKIIHIITFLPCMLAIEPVYLWSDHSWLSDCSTILIKPSQSTQHGPTWYCSGEYKWMAWLPSFVLLAIFMKFRREVRHGFISDLSWWILLQIRNKQYKGSGPQWGQARWETCSIPYSRGTYIETRDGRTLAF